MEELIKAIEQAMNATWERIDQMEESNRLRELRGKRLFYNEFYFGKQIGYLNGLTHALQIINHHIEQTKPTEPVTETGK